VVGVGDFAILGSYPAFHRWIDPALLQKVAESLHKFNVSSVCTTEDRLSMAAILLEVGKPADALDLIDHAAPADLSTRRSLLRATALAALGKPTEAIIECRGALKRDPGDIHARLWLARLLSAAVEKGENPS
jgi:thioredoxin-like negative regulator of GroEL